MKRSLLSFEHILKQPGAEDIPVRIRMIRALQRYPNLFLYIWHCNDIRKGNVSRGLQNIRQKISTDFHNWWTLRKNKTFLKAPYAEAVVCCIEHGVHRWWNFLPNARLDSVLALNNFLRDGVLRRAGDYARFIKIRADLRALPFAVDANEAFYDIMAEYFAKIISDMDAGLVTQDVSLDPARRSFLVGLSVWGEHYLGIFTNYCLPSLLAEGNLFALQKQRQTILFIHTDPAGKETIERAEITRRMKEMGVIILYQMVNEQLIARFGDGPSNKYWHLGMVQSLDLHLAKTLNADYHLLMPDTIYSNNHFAGILKLATEGKLAITRLLLSTAMESIGPRVDRFRSDGIISIPAADLAALSVAHIHAASRPWIVTNKDIATEGSNTHIVVWEGKETLHILSPHQTILYIDRHVIHDIPKRFFMTLDSELDKIIPEQCPIYCPKPEDEVGLIELTSENQRPTEPPRSSIAEFCRNFWYGGSEGSTAYLKFFNEDIIDGVNREQIPGRSYMQEADIAAAKAMIKDAVLATYPKISRERAHIGLRILESIATHPGAIASANEIEQTKALLRAALADA